MRRIVPFLFLAALAGCDPTGNVQVGSSRANVRVVNLVVDAPAIDIRALGVNEVTGVAFGTEADSVSISLLAPTLQVLRTSDALVLGTDSVDLHDGIDYTFFALGKITGFKPWLAIDDSTFADSGSFKVRFVHGIGVRSAVGLDLYLSLPSDSLADISPLIPAIQFGTASSYAQADTAFRRLRLTVAGQKVAVFDTTFATVIPDSTVLTFAGSDQQGGGGAVRLQTLIDKVP